MEVRLLAFVLVSVLQNIYTISAENSEQCGRHIIGLTGEFASPNYPKKYGDNLNCVWIIEAPQNHIIELRFQHFDIENGFDSVEVFDGDSPTAKSLKKYSGSNKPERLLSSGNKLKVNLQSDQLYGGTGFLAQYKASPNKKRNTGVLLKHLPYGKSKIPIASIERIKAVTSNEADNDCRKVLTDANGTIKSPNFPLPYPDQTYCVWIILLEKISKIKIQVLAFDLSPYGEDGDEAWNYLKITSCDDPIIIRGGDRYELPIEIERKCLWTEVVFSGVSMYGNYGFLLKYYSYENPNILIVSNESAKAVTLNTKGVAESFKNDGRPSEKSVVPMFVGLILVLVLTIALAVYIKKTGFIYKIKAASCGRRNYDCGYQEIKD